VDLLTTKKVAQMLDITSDAVRYHERQGHILAIKVDRGGGDFQRLFLLQDVERFVQQRKQARTAKVGAGSTENDAAD
jgi:DNA-binding transcriptional MerR regulator